MDHRRLDLARSNRTGLEHHVIDEFVAGRLDRRAFLRRATLIGMSLPLASFIAACGSDDSNGTTDTTTAGTGDATSTSTGGGAKGGTLKVAVPPPSAAVDPLLVGDLGGLLLLGQTGEYLCYSQGDLTLRPVLAEKWTPNADGTEWTFTIRSGVTFHDGTPMTADDVAATMNRLADPANKSNAQSVFKGVLSAGGCKATDATTVVFTLDGPNGNFPYLVSSDNYNAIILPKSYTSGWDSTFIGTGPFKLDKYTPNVGASFVKNPTYWDTSRMASLDRVEFTFYADEAAQVQALQSGAADMAHNISASGGAALAGSGYTSILLKSSAHRQLHMRTDTEPFTDKRVRQAMGLLLDRPAIVNGLFDGKADVGNDSPFAPAFPSTDTSVAQRAKDVAKAKELLAAAGKGDGFSVQLNAIKVNEVPDYAVLVQNAAKEAGVTLDVKVQESGEFYGDAVYGKSPWLDATMGIVDYGHRGVPNVFLGAPLLSDGTWNSAHFKNPTYDGLVKDYFGALDLDSQKAAAKKIQELLLDETPIIFGYFYNYISWVKDDVKGVQITAMGHIDLATATKG